MEHVRCPGARDRDDRRGIVMAGRSSEEAGGLLLFPLPVVRLFCQRRFDKESTCLVSAFQVGGPGPGGVLLVTRHGWWL